MSAVLDGVVFGRAVEHVREIQNVLEEAASWLGEFIAVPLFHPRLRRHAQQQQRAWPATRSDRELTANAWRANVVGSCSTWLQFDGVSAAMQLSAEECLRQECSWASHMGMQAVILPPPSSSALIPVNYARIVKQLCVGGSAQQHQQLWLKIPMSDSGWEMWDKFRHLVGHHYLLSVSYTHLTLPTKRIV